MRNLLDFAIREEYERVKDLGDKLGALLNRDAFRPILKDLYKNETERGGRPSIDVIMMPEVGL